MNDMKLRGKYIGPILCILLICTLGAGSIRMVLADNAELAGEELEQETFEDEEAEGEEETEADELEEDLKTDAGYMEDEAELFSDQGEDEELSESRIVDFALMDDGNNPDENKNGIVLSDMFQFPANSDSFVHPQNEHQAVITDNTDGRRGQMWYKYQLDLTKSFEIESEIFLGTKHYQTDKTLAHMRGADGLTFVMHNDSRAWEAYGDGGMGMGVGTDASKAVNIKNGVSLEFDTYHNEGLNDPADREIRRKYNHLLEKVVKEDDYRMQQLFHIGLQELPISSSTGTAGANTWNATAAKNQAHKMLSIFSTTSGETLSKDFGDRSGVNNTGNGYTGTLYQGLEVEDVFGQWHDLKISWDADTYTFTYEIGNNNAKVHAVESHPLVKSESELNALFGFTGEEKKVYWGFTGSTGTYFNYQSIAVKKLPYYVEAEAEKEGGKVDAQGNVLYGKETMEGKLGEVVSYRSTIAVDGQGSEVPLANLQFKDKLEGLELTGDITFEWFDADGVKCQEVIAGSEIVTEENPADYSNDTELKAYFTAAGELVVFGLGNLGEGEHIVIDESLSITYQAVIAEEASGVINDTTAVFSSGTRTAVETNAVPIQVEEFQLSGELYLSKTVDKETAYPGDTLTYTLKLENQTNRAWQGVLKDELEAGLKFPESYSAADVAVNGCQVQVNLEEDALYTEEFELTEGEFVEVSFCVEIDSSTEAGTIIENTAYWNEAAAEGWNRQSETVRTEVNGEGDLELVAPTGLDFGQQKLSAAAKRYPVVNMEFDDNVSKENQNISVKDTRRVKGNWVLKAGLETPFTAESNNTVYHQALIYRDGTTDRVLPVIENGRVVIAGAGESSDIYTNISGNWYQDGMDKGLYLKFNKGEAQVDKYKATIVWQLEDVPTP